nr:MAG TPA: hypothetical protein [Caudoviricetes sp.]
MFTTSGDSITLPVPPELSYSPEEYSSLEIPLVLAILLPLESISKPSKLK